MMHSQRTLRTHASAIIALGLIGWGATPSWGQSDVVQIEEHWELRISQPDPDRSAPQTTMVMSPTGDLSGVHFLFTLNHVGVPAFEAGGLQVQLWDGVDLVDESVANETGTLHHNEEVIRWTQRLTLNEGTLDFRVVDGESESWDEFGGDDLSFSVPTALTRLNSYKPAVSLTESQVSYAENRVVSLILTKLVWVTDDGQVHEQNAPIPIDTSLDP
jgi:hypothetical protein